MSDENKTETTATETSTTPTKAEGPKKASLEWDRVTKLVQASGLATEDKKSWQRVGPKATAHVVIALTKKVSRAYVYHSAPAHPAVRMLSDEERKENRMGNIVAEVDFTQGADAAASALEACFAHAASQAEQAALAAAAKAAEQASKAQAAATANG